MTQKQFIQTVAPIVQQCVLEYGFGVPSAIIAQFCLESAYGTSELAVKANNLAGLKYRPNRCSTACGTYVKVGSEQNAITGAYVSSTMLWMKFKNYEDAIRGYFDFVNIPNYKSIKTATTAQAYLENIKSSGYCTSIKYVQNCINVVNKWNLTQYDNILIKDTVSNNKIKIALDAGHGSATAGKRTPNGYREHWINVKVVAYLEQALNRCGIQTVRIAWNDSNATDDADIPLATRQNQIASANCDYSISCHANAYGNGSSFNSANGVETLIHITDVYQNDSLKFATAIQNRLIQGTKQSNRGVKKQNLAMCNCKKMNVKAACLVEIGFMTNEYEANLMRTDAFCKEQGEDIAKGVCDYLGINYVVGSTATNSPTTSTTTQNTTQNVTESSQTKELRKVGQFHSINFTGVTIATNGLWDATTKKQAVRVLQQAMNLDYNAGLKVDGIWGSKSVSSLGTHYTRKGETQHMVTALVILLLLHGYCIPLDKSPETFDENIENAVKQFQKAVGLPVTGIASANTYKLLLK